MKQTSSLILKNKRIFTSVLLFFVITLVILPNTSHAFSINENQLCGTKEKTVTQVVDSKGNRGTFEEGPDVAKGGLDAVFNISSYIPGIPCFDFMLAKGIAFMGDIIAYAGEYFAYFAGAIFNFVGSQLMSTNALDTWSITKNSGIAGPAFYQVWGVIKEWANMLVVLGFIGVALAFILNLETYKKYLVPLLIVALLVNFSVVFVGLIIDASNIVMQQISGGSQEGLGLIYKINTGWNNSLWRYPVSTITDAVIYLAISGAFAWMYIMVGISLFMFALIFIERYVILAILFILSPLAIVMFAIPLGKKYADKWLGSLIQFAFIGIIGAFFLNLASSVIATFNSSGKFGVALNADPSQIMGALGELLFFLLIAEVFLFAGIYMTFKSSGPVANVVIGGGKALGLAGLAYATGGMALLAKGTAKVAGKAAGGVAGGATGAVVGGLGATFKKGATWKSAGEGAVSGMKTGAGKGANLGSSIKNAYSGVTGGVKNAFNKAGEFIGAVPAGSASQAEIERNKARIDKKVEAAAEHANITQITHGAQYGTSANKAVYQKQLAEKGEFSLLGDENKQRTAMENMVNHGYSTKEVIDKNPFFAKFNKSEVNDLMKTSKIDRGAAEEELVNRSLKKANLSELSTGIFKNEERLAQLLSNTTDKKLREASKNLATDKQDEIEKLRINAPTMIYEHGELAKKAKAAGNIEEAERLATKVGMYQKALDTINLSTL